MAGTVECRSYDPKDPLKKNIYKRWDIIKVSSRRWVALDMEGHKHFYASSLERLKELMDESYDDPGGC